MLLYFAWAAVPMVPAELKPHLLAQLQALGQTVSPPTVLVVANYVLAAQFALQARLNVPVVRPHGLYVNSTYAPVAGPDGRHRVFVTRIGHWARESGVALLELTERFSRADGDYPFQIIYLSIQRKGYPDTARALSYDEFAQFHACIFWPWDVMMLLFNELYSMTMPILMPEPRWMYTLMQHSLSQTKVNWWHIRAETVSGSLPWASERDFPLPFLPWVTSNASLREVAYWYELTDFVQFPHVVNFASVPDMLYKLRTLDVAATREGMRQFNIATLKDTRRVYQQAAVKLFVPERHRPMRC